MSLLTISQIENEIVEDLVTVLNIKDKKYKLLRQKMGKKIAALKEIKEKIIKGSGKKGIKLDLLGLFSYNIKHNTLYSDLAVSSMN